jgi:hypothetical protein
MFWCCFPRRVPSAPLGSRTYDLAWLMVSSAKHEDDTGGECVRFCYYYSFVVLVGVELFPIFRGNIDVVTDSDDPLGP